MRMIPLRAAVLGLVLEPVNLMIPPYRVGRADWWRSYSRYLGTRRWRWRRRLVILRDGGGCRECYARGTDVHHLTYERVGHERLGDLVLLCAECHMEIDAEDPGLTRTCAARSRKCWSRVERDAR
jgi:hypothetical protein